MKIKQWSIQNISDINKSTFERKSWSTATACDIKIELFSWKKTEKTKKREIKTPWQTHLNADTSIRQKTLFLKLFQLKQNFKHSFRVFLFGL